ncbi:unnamed protein product [Effrenium voratum]|uniref:Uncharacterized protein n=1 Tax=Effrenium voratum TaxID=2562239 RepID=A0AA36IE48_9DINO|nr:unnamed protein product [Effrenium voratum]
MDFDEHDLEEGDGAFIEKALYGITAALALSKSTYRYWPIWFAIGAVPVAEAAGDEDRMPDRSYTLEILVTVTAILTVICWKTLEKLLKAWWTWRKESSEKKVWREKETNLAAAMIEINTLRDILNRKIKQCDRLENYMRNHDSAAPWRRMTNACPHVQNRMAFKRRCCKDCANCAVNFEETKIENMGLYRAYLQEHRQVRAERTFLQCVNPTH